MQPAVRLSAAVQSAGVTLASINDSNWQQCTSPTFHFLSRRQRSRVVRAKQKHAKKNRQLRVYIVASRWGLFTDKYSRTDTRGT